MNIGLIKTYEDNNQVFYQAFLNDVYEKHFHTKALKKVSKYAVLKFNKKSNDIEFIWESTDPYFRENRNQTDQVRILTLGKMIKCNKEGYFPDKTGIATG